MINGLRKYWIIPASLIFAFMLVIMPLPKWAEYIRPEWLAMVLIYWWMAFPEKLGIALGFICGLTLDVALGSLMGQHALGLVIIAYIVSRIYQRIRVLPELQQSLIVFALLIIYKFILLWLYGLSGQAPKVLWLYLATSFSSALLWPWLFITMRELRRAFIPSNS